MDQQWFEMTDILRQQLNNKVWIPLRVVRKSDNNLQFGHLGYIEEFSGLGCIAVPTSMVEKVDKLGWSDIGIGGNQVGYFDGEAYIPSDEYRNYHRELFGIHPVLTQRLTSIDIEEWHLHQDIVMTLRLLKEGDKWICPSEGYVDVVRLIRNNDGEPESIEMRAEHLKDYLCGRDMKLYGTSYHSRRFVTDDASYINWKDGEKRIQKENYEWTGRITEIHEGGMSYGKGMAVIHTARTDIYEDEDVPDISELPTEENSETKTWDRHFEGRKLFMISSDLWRNEWVEPAENSSRILGETNYQSVFIIDAEGNRLGRDDLIESGKWLWFKPGVITNLSQRRGGTLTWYTQDTGSVGCVPDESVHFGMNDLGLINVYAKDIALLPEWQQQIWAGYNIGPEGGVSKELLASQVKADPADTKSPEFFLQLGIFRLFEVAENRLNISILRNHAAVPEILKRTHRFRATDDAELFSLAKDLARLTADNINEDEIQTIIQPPPDETWKSLKSIEKLISQKVHPDLARKITAPLVGAYELRHADAHLPSEELDEAFDLVRIDRELPIVIQGRQLIISVTTSIWTIIDIIERWDELPNQGESQ